MEKEETTKPQEPTCIAPLPYLYDEEDNRVKAILEQVTEHCEIVLEKTEERVHSETVDETDEEGNVTTTTKTTTETVVIQEGEKPAEVWHRVWQALRFISNHACWTGTDSDTFILQCREQVITAQTICGCDRNCCKCDPDQIVVDLEYSPTPDQPFVDGMITVVIGGKPKHVSLTAEYLNDHYDYTTGKLYIMRDDFPDILYYQGRCCCLCRRNLTITLHYNAGYEKVPNGLLPLICPILAQIDEAKIPLSDCSSAMTKVSGLLKSLKKGDVQYTWSDTDTAASKTNALFTEMFDIALVTELSSISRCDQVNMPDEFGDVV